MGRKKKRQWDLTINSKNIIGWLLLSAKIAEVDQEIIDAIVKYDKREDVIHKQKELEDIFGGEEW